MSLRAWYKKRSTRNNDAATENATFPVSVFWRSICSLRQPVLLVKNGIQIIAATEETHELFGSSNVTEIHTLLTGVDAHTLNRIQMAISNPVALVTEVPIRIQNPGLYINLAVTISALPEYPEEQAALLFLKDCRNSTVPQWAKTSRDLLSRIPFPSWVVAPDGSVVFSNAAYSDFPLELLRGESSSDEKYPDRGVYEQIVRALFDLETMPAKVRNTLALTDHDYNLGPYGKWRITHFPLRSQGGERMVSVLAMPTECAKRRKSDQDGDASPVALMGPDALTQVLQVREAERMALAREVHDSLGQELTVLKLEMRRLYNMVADMATGSNMVLEHFKSVRSLVDNLAKTARRIAYEMRQDLATIEGLSHSVQDMVLDLRERMGIQIQLELMPGWVEPEQGMAHNMHRSLQEMLNNVSKHAKANRCLVRMGLSANQYWLEVRDDGVGMPPDVGHSSIGLRSLNERAALYGGHVVIQSRPVVDGTSVRVELPERRAQGAQARP